MATIRRSFSRRNLLRCVLTFFAFVFVTGAVAFLWGSTHGFTKPDPNVDSAASAAYWARSRRENSRNDYSLGGLVDLYATKVVGASNPSESYAYYSLPYCRQDTAIGGHWAWLDAQQSLYHSHGHTLDGGDRYEHLPVELHFGEDLPAVATCRASLTPQDAAAFRDAVHRGFQVQMALVGKTAWQPVGTVDRTPDSGTAPQYSLYTDHHFDIDYDESTIRGFRVTTDRTRFADVTDVGAGADVTFTYSATWTRVPKQPGSTSFLEWLQTSAAAIKRVVLNTHFLRVVLALFVSLCMCQHAYRVVWADGMARTRDVESALSAVVTEDGPWLACCRSGTLDPPAAYSALLCAVAGSGEHLMCAFGMTVVLQWISLCNSGAFFGNPTVQGMPLWLGQFALAWAYTAGSAGRVAGVYHKLLNGKLWTRTGLLTALLASGPFVAVTLALDRMAREHHTTLALPPYQLYFLSISAALALGLIGLGLRAAATQALAATILDCGSLPVRPAAVYEAQQRRPRQRLQLARLAGIGCICALVLATEYHRVLAEVWGFESSSSPICVLLALGTLCCLAICLVLVLTHRQLAQPGPAAASMWWRPPAIVAASVGLALFALSVNYHVTSSHFEGAYQVTRYYMVIAVWCYVAVLAVASIGLRVALCCTLLATADTWQEALYAWRLQGTASLRGADIQDALIPDFLVVTCTRSVTVSATPMAAAAEGPAVTGPAAASEAAGRDGSAHDSAAACTGVVCDADSERTALLADAKQ